ncbi:PAS domain S-box protein [Novispirillum sp. DQ9]|uniref:sensor domain-containing protein n=1 Tax=Novispirillum sp. DQ9 TaxID=3398612 RepID=UPI003C7D7A3C
MVPDFLCLCDGGVITYVNGAGARMMGYEDARGLVGRLLADIIHPDYAPLLEDGVDVLVGDEYLPLMFTRADGSPVEAEVRAQFFGDGPAEGQDGADVPVLLHVRDITERMRSVNHVLESEQRYRSLVNLALDMICLISDGAITLINLAGQKLLEHAEPDALIGRPVRDMVHPDYHAVVDLGLDALAEETALVPLMFITANGEAVDVEMRVRALAQAGAYMIEARDIRARLRSAEAVREREARLQGILDTVAEGIITADERGIIQSFNRAAERIFGRPAKDVVGRNLSLLMPQPDAVRHDGYLEAYRGGGGGAMLGRSRELSGLRADGTTFPLELNISELRLGKARLFTGIIRDITERKRAEEAEQRYKRELEVQVEEQTRDIRRMSRQFQGILDSAGDGIIGVDLDAVITFANPAAAAVLGWGGPDLVGRPADEVFRYAEGPKAGRGVPVRAALRRGIFNERTELMLARADGSAVAAEYGSSPIDDEGERTGAVVVLRDITERKAAEERLRVAAAVFDTTIEGVLVCAPDGRITMANPAFSAILRPTGGAPLGDSVVEVLFAEDPALWAKLLDALRVGGHWEHEFWSHRLDGEAFAARLVASPVMAGDGTVGSVVLVVNDITQRKRDEERIRYQANYDMLTGLPNRTLFHDRLDQAVRGARRSGQPMALMFIDLDGFKAVNDTLGHEAGDQLLQGAAQRLSQCVRDNDTVARLGGDEFTVIMTTVSGAEGAALVAQRIINSLEVPFDLGGRVGRVSGSIGIAVMPEHGESAEDILRNADAAMYHAKDQGKANYQFYRPELAPS